MEDDYCIMKQLKERIYNDIFERILQGDLKSDELIKENNLIEYYGVSRAPVREALLMLCTEGVLKSIPRAGYQIVQISDKQEVEIMQFRVFLECGALRANWKYINEQFIEKLMKADENQNLNSPEPFSKFWESSIKFHTLLISAGNNRYAADVLRTAMRTQYRAFAQYIWNLHPDGDMPTTDLGHRALLDSMKKGDLALSLYNLEKDIMNFRIYDKFFH